MSAAEVIDLRGGRRSSVFLAAVLHVGGSSSAVRIRDLSSQGARVDGSNHPGEGSVVRLKRGPHSVVARVAWSAPDACGLRFSTPVPVQEWIGYGSGHSGQQQVDDIIASVRAGTSAVVPVETAGEGALFDRLETADQLELLARQLGQIAEGFSASPAIIDQALAGLQNLDIATQRLSDLANRMRTGGR